jgi:hypothetical protein
MQSFVGKLTHACPVYYCSRSARPRALPAGLSVVAADWPHVSNSGYDGSSGIQHHHLGLGVGFEFRHEVPPRRLRRTSRHPRVVGQVRREDREHVLRPSAPWADSGCASASHMYCTVNCIIILTVRVLHTLISMQIITSHKSSELSVMSATYTRKCPLINTPGCRPCRLNLCKFSLQPKFRRVPKSCSLTAGVP